MEDPDRRDRRKALIDDERWGLLSPRVGERRAAVRELLRRPILSGRARRALRDRLVADPDPQVRLDALDALARRRPLDPRPLRSALSDPVEDVRNRAVGLLAELGALTPDDLGRLWKERSEPDPRTVLGVLAGAAEHEPLDEGRLRLVLMAAGALPSPARLHTPDLVRLARAIGSTRLIAALEDRGSRLGAARLLVADERPDALAAVAEREGDELEGVRVAATLARSLLGGVPRAPGEDPDHETPVRPRVLTEVEMNGEGRETRSHSERGAEALLSLLDEPSASVRRAAAIDLLRAPSPTIARRIVEALSTDELAAALRGVVEVDDEPAIRHLIGLLTTEARGLGRDLGPLLEELFGDGGPRLLLRTVSEPAPRTHRDGRTTGR